MKTSSNLTKINGFLIAAFLSFSFVFPGLLSAQTGQRSRIIKNKPVAAPTATPKTTPTPVPIVSPISTPTPTPVSEQTLSELQTQLRAITSRPELRRGHIGVKIAALDSGKIIYEENAEKYFMPASNMKNFTVAAALEKLTPDFRFATSAYAPAKPDANGTIRGDLTIYGRGDVSFSGTFYDGDYYKGLDALAQKLADSGLKRVEGNLIGDESYFKGFPIPSTWEWDDLQWYYGAEVSALGIGDNSVDLSVKPGSQLNAPCFVQVTPVNTIIKIINNCVTGPAGTKREIKVFKKLDQDILEISGTFSADDKGYSGMVTVAQPAELFVEVLRGLLLKKGIAVTGQNRVSNGVNVAVENNQTAAPKIEIARLESLPLSIIAAKTMKPSQNLYTETILWTLGEEIGDKTDPKKTSAERGLAVVQKFLSDAGIAPDSIIQWDGSGLSRHDLVTPSSVVQLYAYMAKSRYANVWREALTVGGVDGTLRNRFKGTSAENNVRGKTGTIDQVSALSGYLTTAAGEKLIFSVIINAVNDSKLRNRTIDDIVVKLTDFNSKIN